MRLPFLFTPLTRAIYFASFATLALNACGGGGGGGSGAPEQIIDDGSGGGSETLDENRRYSISGTISAAVNSAVDSDTNDVFANQTSNNAPSTSQPLPNPVTLGGFVTYTDAAGSTNGCSNRNDTDDNADYFSLNLFADQTIDLFIADRDNADLDLYLLSPDGSVKNKSNSSIADESMVVAEDGDYLILVCSYAGGSNYQLAVGQNFATRGGSSRLSADTKRHQSASYQGAFVSGEVIIQWANPHQKTFFLEGAHMAQTDETVSLFRMNEKLLAQYSRSKLFTFANPEDAANFATTSFIKSLKSNPDVSVAEPNGLLAPQLEPNDPGYDAQWHYSFIGLPEAWEITTGSSNVIVAVIDTGVLLDHPDLQGKFDANDPNGYDFISNAATSNDGDGRDGNADDPGDKPGASSFHGTHVAGTIAAASNNGVGVSGVAWDVSIMPLRVLGNDGGTSFDVRQAVLYAAGLPSVAPTTPVQRADIINLSLGGEGYSQTEQDAYTAARNAGVIIIAAAGNEASSTPNYPAAYDGVVSVSAVTIEKKLAPYSNYGDTIDVAAPGGDTRVDVDGDGFADGILSTGGNDSNRLGFVYHFLQGTSMATPHVAGVAALMKSVYSDLSPDDFDNLLASGSITEDLGSPGYDPQFGFGLIDARAAVAQAQMLAGGGSVPDNPRLVANPNTLGFGAFIDSLDVNLSNSGTGAMQVLSVIDDAAWMTVTPSSTQDSGLGRYQVSIDRSDLDDGAYKGQITAISNSNTITINVIMQVGSQFLADAGLQYIQLVNADDDTVLSERRVSATNSEYRFNFDEVPLGNYQVFSGSDFDNDGFICDTGESCGAWRTLDQPAIIQILKSDIENINFNTGYETELSQPAIKRAESLQQIVRDRLSSDYQQD